MCCRFYPYGQAMSISFRIIHVVNFINVVPHTCKIVTRIEGHGMEHTLSHDRHIDTMLYTKKLDIFLNCSHFEGLGGLQAIKVCWCLCDHKYRIIERTILLSLPYSVGKKQKLNMGRNYFLSRHPMGWAKLAKPHELGICYALPSLMTIFTHNLSHPLSDYFWWKILSILQNVLTKKLVTIFLLFYKRSWQKLGINFF